MAYSDDENDGGNASDFDRAMSSGDDEEEAGFTRQGKLPRYQYRTFQDGDDNDSDNNDDELNDSRTKRRPKISHEERIYGVFYTEGMSSDSGDDDDEKNILAKRPKRKKHKKPFFKSTISSSKSSSVIPMFVKGDVLLPETELEEEQQADRKPPAKRADETDTDTFKASSPSEPTVDDAAAVSDAEVELERKQRAEKANQHFLNLLRNGKASKRSSSQTRVAATAPPPNEVSSSADIHTPFGLGFQNQEQEPGAESPSCAAAVTGIGFQSAAAGIGFQSASVLSDGGVSGLGSQKPRIDDKETFSAISGGIVSKKQEPKHEEPSCMVAGLGFGQFGGSKPSPFAQKDEKPTPKLDPNLGRWEKHTKGIGAKLLAKMGYSGSGGLGSKKRKLAGADGEGAGAAGPIQVKVRPANLGLGYGGFKEATHLNKKQQDKAAKKNTATDSKQDANPIPPQSTTSFQKSAIPTVQELLKDESWRADEALTAKRGTRSNRRSEKPKIISYKELLEQQKELSKNLKIVDMRGPLSVATENVEDQDALAEPPLAEELLHNVSLLMGTHESKLYSSHQMESATRKKLESMQADADSLLGQKRELQQRHEKMATAIRVLEQIKAVDASAGKAALVKIKPLLQHLAFTFSQEERDSLQFSQVIIPALLQPILNQEFAQLWDPLASSITESEKLIQNTFDALLPAFEFENGDEQQKIIESIWRKFVLPRAQQAFETSDWSRGENVEHSANLYQLLLEIAKQEDQYLTKTSVRTEDSSEQPHVLPVDEEPVAACSAALVGLVHKQLIYNTVHPKLLGCISGWKPTLDESRGRLENPIDQFFLPWLPHLDHRGLLPQILQDCRSKVRSSLIFLQNHLNEEDYLAQAIRAVRPWRGILKAKYMEEMVSTLITTKLARSIALQKPSPRVKEYDWTLANILFDLHSDGLITSNEFLSIVEGELLNQLCCSVYDMIQEGLASEIQSLLVRQYNEWKNHLLGHGPSVGNDKFSGSRVLLCNDIMICRHFYSILIMIQNARISDLAVRDGSLPHPQTTNYRIVLSRRREEERRKLAEDLARMDATGEANSTGGRGDSMQEARVRLSQRNHSHIPTFREVVEEFAVERGILFQPRLGDRATHIDGKQIFMFGSVPVYLDANVVYAFMGNTKEWEPVSLDELCDQNARSSA